MQCYAEKIHEKVINSGDFKRKTFSKCQIGLLGILKYSERCYCAKGGVRITEEHVLFSTKYSICKKLGTGRSGTVFLAFHKELETYRAIKVVPKTMADYETFRKEALFLKTLRHPGIPLVYDVVEYSNHSFLIEEYLEGESIYALVKRLGTLSIKMTVDLGIQICRIIHFMNTAEKPILYLDLQPKNLLVNNGIVKLTDFDHAHYADDVRDFGERYGTVGFAAPEQYSGEPLDCRTDVYAIGALLYFMCRGCPPGKEPEPAGSSGAESLDRIIRGCMAADREDRYANAGDVECVLTELKNKLVCEQAIESRIILCMSAKNGSGSTHVALALANFLTRNGCTSLYQELTDSSSVRNLAHYQGAKQDEYGEYHFGCFHIRPFYGNSVKLPYRFYPNIIKDIGISWKEERELPEADLYILICGSRCWERDYTLQALRQWKERGTDDKLVLIWNCTSAGTVIRLPEEFRGVSCINLPYFENPFAEDPAADACFERLMNMKTGKATGWKRIKDLFRRRKKN